jgi:hypothetical protein
MNESVILAALIIAAVGLTYSLQSHSQGFMNPDPEARKAPTAISENNIYVAWSSNNTGNEEVMFRASTDGGNTFDDKINLSNTTDAASDRVDITAEGGNVVVTWWETNETTEMPVAKISNDFGKTFGPLMELGANGTIGTGEAKPIV